MELLEALTVVGRHLAAEQKKTRSSAAKAALEGTLAVLRGIYAAEKARTKKEGA